MLRDRKRLASAVAQYTTFTDVIRAFGLEPSGKRIALVRRLVVEYGLSTDHFGKLEGYGRYSRAALEEAAHQRGGADCLQQLARLRGQLGHGLLPR